MSALTADGPGAGPRRPSTPSGPRAAALAETVRNLRTALLLGWRVESNWTDPVLFFIYTVARPIASLLLLVAMVTIIGGTAQRPGPDVRDPGQRAVGDARRRPRGARVVGARGPRALPDAQVPVRRARRRSSCCSSDAAARASRPGAMGTAVALVFAVIILGLRIDLAGRAAGRCSPLCLVLGIVPILALGVLLAAVCLQTRQESWSYPDAFAGALFLISGRRVPAVRRCRRRSRSSASSTPSPGGWRASGSRWCPTARRRSAARARCGPLSPVLPRPTEPPS